MLRAKARWYSVNHDQANQFKYFTILIKKYGAYMDANNGYECDNFMDCDLNTWCWMIFKFSVDKEQIDAAIESMKGVVKRYEEREQINPGFIDTYANLLYKAGRTNEAMVQEESAIRILIRKKATESDMKDFIDTLERMKAGKPTWPHYIDKDDFFHMGLM
jgi:hypothetical protein